MIAKTIAARTRRKKRKTVMGVRMIAARTK